jgi:hypothetical protein
MTVIVHFRTGWDFDVQNRIFGRILSEIPEEIEAKGWLVAAHGMGMVNFPGKERQLAEDMAKALLYGVRRLAAREESGESGEIDEEFVAYLHQLVVETEDYLNGRKGPYEKQIG